MSLIVLYHNHFHNFYYWTCIWLKVVLCRESIMQKIYNEWTVGWMGRKTHFCLDVDSSTGLSSSRFSPTPDKSGSSPTKSWSSLLMSSCRAATFSRCFLGLSWLTNLRNQQSWFVKYTVLPWKIPTLAKSTYNKIYMTITNVKGL